jgi:hypothetical protein
MIGNIVAEQDNVLAEELIKFCQNAVAEFAREAIRYRASLNKPMLEADNVRTTARALGLEAARQEIWRSEDIAPAFARTKKVLQRRAQPAPISNSKQSP